MQAPEFPPDEAARQAMLESTGLLDSPAEERFDRITRIAQRCFEVPIALVSLVDKDRQWFKSKQGLAVCETPRAISFCGHAIHAGAVFVVEDTLADARFVDNPLVTANPNIRFYAGCPISLDGSRYLGTLCLIDSMPRVFPAEDQEVLRDMARLVEDEISMHHLAAIDDLTRIPNRRFFLKQAAQSLELAYRHGIGVNFLYFDLDGFKQLNDLHGHKAGDRALQAFAAKMKIAFRKADVIGRMGGDEFCALVFADDEHAVCPSNRLRALLAAPEAEFSLQFTVGMIHGSPDRAMSIETLMEEADLQMLRRKRNRKSASRQMTSRDNPGIEPLANPPTSQGIPT